MLTGGDIEFEPDQPKILALSNSIYCLLAGDSYLQAEIMKNVADDVWRRIKEQPEHWWKLKEVAELYAHYCKKAQFGRAEDVVLAPLGLNNEKFLADQNKMAPTLVEQLAAKLTNFRAPQVQTLFCGIDPDGAHIYVSDNWKVTCRDLIGFAAIGSGASHANSQFMFEAYTRHRSFSEALLLTYSSKKRAEVAPGVGKQTDMFMVGPLLGQSIFMGTHVIDRLERIYSDTQQMTMELHQKARTAIGEYVAQVTKPKAAEPQVAASPSLPEPPVITPEPSA